MNICIEYGNYGFTTRLGGFSSGSYSTNNMGLHTDDDKDLVIKNRTQLATKLGFTLNDFVVSNQTHSNNYYRVTS